MSPSSRIRSRPPPSIVGTAESKRLGVRVVRAVEDDVRRAELLQPAEVEDGDAVRDVAHDAEVVGDEEVRDPLLRLELDEEVEDRGLHRHVERGGRLVADDELRVAGERARDRDPLLEAAGELNRLLRQRPLRHADARDEIAQPLPRQPRRRSPRASHRAQEDAADRVAPVERRVRVLEDDLERPQVVARALLVPSAGAFARRASPCPRSAATMPSSVRASVVLPLPDSPTSPSVSPGQTAALTSVSACTSCPRCVKTFDELLDLDERRLAARSTRGRSRSAASARGSAGARSWYQQRLSWPRSTIEERRLLLVAAVVGERAAVGEHAARELDAERRQEAGDRVEPAVVLAHASARDAAQEADRVRVARVAEHRVDRAFLDQPTCIEHADAVAHLRDHAEVVADEEHGGVELRLELRDEVEHLGLDRRVEARSSARRGSGARGSSRAPSR